MGAVSEFRVFLSAVTSEFGTARDALANDLQAGDDVTVCIQRSFRNDGKAGTLLEKLHNYVERCNVVVCLVGTRSGGGFPTSVEAAPFRTYLPAGVSEASYTQWEFYFARYYERRCHVYFAARGFRRTRRDASAGDRPDLQETFAAAIKALGVPWIEVRNIDAFRAEVLKDLLHGRLPAALSARLTETLARVTSKPIVLPYPSLGALFKGRDGFMRRLRTSLTRADGGTAAIAGRAVHGLGGVGKTRAAVEYAWAHRDDYTALTLLDAETPEKLQSSLAALVGPLRLPAQAAPEEVVRVEAVLDWLNANPRWFLILDNIDSEPALAAAHRLLGRLSGGHVVMTSRLTRFPRGVERLDLDVLTPDDATDFLLAATAGRHRSADDAAQARVLAAALGGLALALEMAAATIEARGLGFAAYQALWQGNRKRVVGWAKAEITGYHHAVAETWQTSVDQLSEPGRHLLARLAFLAPEPVPVSLLDVAVPNAAGDGDAHAALDDLVTYSLATRDAEGGTFLVHRLVQDVTRRELAEAGTETQRLTEALGWVGAAFVGDPGDVRNWAQLAPLAPHAAAVAGHADAAGISNPTGRLLHHVGSLFQSRALYARAEPLMRRALAIGESSFGKEHPNVVSALNNLAILLRSTNQLGEAESILRRALAIEEANLGGHHARGATTRSNLAELLQYTNRVDEAEVLMRCALAADEANLGKDHPAVADDLNNLASLLHASNRLSEAEPLLRRALTIYETCRDEEHPDVATVLNSLGRLLQDTNRYRQAERFLRRALSIYEASLGQNHPTVAIALNNVAVLLLTTNRLDEAEPLLRRALAIDEANLGQNHPNVARDISGLAMLLKDTNRSEEAWPLLRRALAIDEASFGEDHPNIALRLNNLTSLLSADNRPDEAEPLMRRALAIDEASLGKDHPDVARDLNNLAVLLMDTNRPVQAAPLMRRAMAIYAGFQRDTGHAHPHRDAVTEIYVRLLEATCGSESEVAAEIAALRREAGLGPA
jgi:tetratricopeptide (TPR) repeat protein